MSTPPVDSPLRALAEAAKARCESTTADGAWCHNNAVWKVNYTTPDDGKTMRTRASTLRCYWHRKPEWLPAGATQIVTEALP